MREKIGASRQYPSLNKLLVLFFVALSVGTFGQENKSDQKMAQPKLVNWKGLDCDNTYDPYLLVDRITAFYLRDGRTYLTVNFADHCCPTFGPKIEFKDNSLYIVPYTLGRIVERCDCNCCFSIEFQIDNLPESGYEVYFRGKQIERSEHPYPLVKPSQELHNGQVINRRNKYGFNEGTWITFYDDGNIKLLSQYPEKELQRLREPLFRKLYYRSGKLREFSRKDTTEAWFEDGELKTQWIDYKKGDTTFSYNLNKYDNRQISNRSFEKSYPWTFTSEFDSSYQGKGITRDVAYKQEYFENGKPKFLYGRDTSYSWHDNGHVKSKKYKNGEIQFEKTGLIVKRFYYWKTKGPAGHVDIQHSLHVTYTQNEIVSEIEYMRGEYGLGIRYTWKWDKSMKLIESPQKWKEELPWKKFIEIAVKI